MTLDFRPDQLHALLQKTVEAAGDFLETHEQRSVVQAPDMAFVRSLFSEPLPEKGLSMNDLFSEIRSKIFDTATVTTGPRAYPYVQTGGNHWGMVGEMLAPVINQNGAKWHLSPTVVEIERLVIQWISDFIGFGSNTAGFLNSGGSMANFMALSVALHCQAPWDIANEGLAAAPQITAYVSDEGHSCLEKAIDLLGIGRKNLRHIGTTANDQIDLLLLKRAIEKDKREGLLPLVVIGNAGTVNTGAVDPLNDLADIAAEHKMWLHLDGAYGGPAAASKRAGHLFAGLERADSVAIDPHKWLYVPFDAGCTLVKNWSDLNKTFKVKARYLETGQGPDSRFELYEHSFQLSRGFKALKIWTTFKGYGAQAIRDAIDDNIDVTQKFAQLIKDSDDFELMAATPLSVTCFRYCPSGCPQAELNQLNERLARDLERDGRFFLASTRIGSDTALRTCFVNHRTKIEHATELIHVLRELGCRIATSKAQA